LPVRKVADPALVAEPVFRNDVPAVVVDAVAVELTVAIPGGRGDR
jgi:hypothetical protein